MGKLSNCERKTIEAYAAMRSAPRMMEKALNQPMQNFSLPSNRQVKQTIYQLEKTAKRLKAVLVLRGWIEEILKWDNPDYQKIGRYRKAERTLLQLCNLY